MNENIIKQPPLPDTIHFHTTPNDTQTEVMRITRDGVWVSPDMQVDEVAKAVLDVLGYQVSVLVQKAVEEEREACAKLCDDKVDAEYATGKVDHNEMGWTQACALAIRARGEK